MPWLQGARGWLLGGLLRSTPGWRGAWHRVARWGRRGSAGSGGLGGQAGRAGGRAGSWVCSVTVQLLKSADLGRQSLLYLKEIGHGWFGKVSGPPRWGLG